MVLRFSRCCLPCSTPPETPVAACAPAARPGAVEAPSTANSAPGNKHLLTTKRGKEMSKRQRDLVVAVFQNRLSRRGFTSRMGALGVGGVTAGLMLNGFAARALAQGDLDWKKHSGDTVRRRYLSGLGERLSGRQPAAAGPGAHAFLRADIPRVPAGLPAVVRFLGRTRQLEKGELIWPPPRLP